MEKVYHTSSDSKEEMRQKKDIAWFCASDKKDQFLGCSSVVKEQRYHMNKREQKPLTPAAGRETDLVKSQQPLSSPGEKEKMSHSLDHLIGLSSDTKKDHSNKYFISRH